MALEKTSVPGVYRRHRETCTGGRCSCSYEVRFKVAGRTRQETFPTLAEARAGKEIAKRRVGLLKSHERGLHAELIDRCPECEKKITARVVTLRVYALEWIERYRGTGKRGFRDQTRDEYRALLKKYALKFFDSKTTLGEIEPRQIASFIDWLCRQPNRNGGTLADSSVHNAFKPLAACLATARREGLIRHNPASEATMPHRPRVEEEEKARPFPRIEQDDEPTETMEIVVALIPAKHRLLFELLAATGLRRSELLALRGRDLHLNGERPYIAVRRRVRRQKGKGLVEGALKSRHARRNLPIPIRLADKLRALKPSPDALVFASRVGTHLDADNLAERVLRPACEEAGVSWAGFHTFRHTVASRMFDQGRNVVQVQKWLGHHAASFTLDTYVHLLEDDLGGPVSEPLHANQMPTEGSETVGNEITAKLLDLAA